MTRAEHKVLSALASLHGSPDWQTVKEWLVESRDADVAALIQTREEAPTRWLQGSVQCLSSIIDTSNSAMEVMHRNRTK